MDWTISLVLFGALVILFGLFSNYLKERLHLSESLIATLMGILLGPHGFGILNPSLKDTQAFATWQAFTRVVLVIQVLSSAIGLSSRFLRRQYRSILPLYLPSMLVSWCICTLLLRLFFETQIGWLGAAIISAAITPTDPILSTVVIKGKFAEDHVPFHLRSILSAESAGNDGCALLLFTLPFYVAEARLYEYVFDEVLRHFCLSIALGFVVGNVCRAALDFSRLHALIDKESFLAFSLAFCALLTGLCDFMGACDLLAVFVGGLVLSWNDWFAWEIKGEKLQEVLDLCLNLTYFVLFGAILPWTALALDGHSTTGVDTNPESLSLGRLLGLVLLIHGLRRLPVIYGLRRAMPLLSSAKEALFVAWFGPIGVGSLYYAHLIVDSDVLAGPTKPALKGLQLGLPIIYFVVLSSVFIHGFTIPLFHLTIRATMSITDVDIDFSLLLDPTTTNTTNTITSNTTAFNSPSLSEIVHSSSTPYVKLGSLEHQGLPLRPMH